MTGDQVFRIANFSGFSGDRPDALKTQSEGSGCPVLFGDYLAEFVREDLSRSRRHLLTQFQNLAYRTLELRNDPILGYERNFLNHLALAARSIAAKKQRVITDAGALNPKGLAEAADALLRKQGIVLKVAYVEGDDIINRLDELREKGETLNHLEGGDRPLWTWDKKPIAANAYIGARGIRAALEAGAELIIVGRCTDASPVIGAAAWWYNWSWDDYDALAGALLAGHCIECGAYISGGNTSGFTAYKDKYYDFSMGIAEIERDGIFVITKQAKEQGFNGMVDDVTVRSQILYEIQGNVYLNPDVQALIDDISVSNVGTDRVRVTGMRGIAPPETTKAAVCAIGGYQAETMIFATGMDIEEKFETYREQIRRHLGDRLRRFSTWDMTQYGVAAVNPRSEAEGTAMLRIFAQSPDIEAFGPAKNLAAITNPEGLGHYPGLAWLLDRRAAVPMPYIEYWPGLVKQKHLPQTVKFVGSDVVLSIPPMENTAPVVKQRDYDNDGFDAAAWGPTTRGPIGHIVHARSGDKGGNANVGFFVRHADEWPWLRAFLSKQRLIELLEREYIGNRIERVEFPGMRAVHFVIHDYLGAGVSSTARLDNLAKSVAEYLRAKHVDLPDKFLGRGKL